MPKYQLKRYKLKKRADKRGFLVQNDYPQIGRRMKHFLLSFSEPGIVRGNHYHQKKREWFYILAGKARLYFYDLKTKTKGSCLIDSRKPELVEMEPMIVHAIENVGQEQMIFLGIVNEAFNPKKPDTFDYKIK